VVIVTQNQYIIASKIHHISLDEQLNYREIHVNSRMQTVKETYHTITVVYTPLDTTNNNNNFKSSEDTRECSVTIRSKLNAYKVFQNLIQQIREQMPDQLYLDKALEAMLSGNDLSKVSSADVEETRDQFLTMKETPRDRKSKKVRSIRKTKRASQKVLRNLKRSR
jgi:hypothetical protein